MPNGFRVMLTMQCMYSDAWHFYAQALFSTSSGKTRCQQHHDIFLKLLELLQNTLKSECNSTHLLSAACSFLVNTCAHLTSSKQANTFCIQIHRTIQGIKVSFDIYECGIS